MELPLIPEREFVLDFMKEKMLTTEILSEHLHSNITQFLAAISNHDTDKIKLLAEGNFANKVIARLNPNHGFKFKEAAYDPDKVQVVDKLLIKGVGVDRSTNDTNMDYVRAKRMEA